MLKAYFYSVRPVIFICRASIGLSFPKYPLPFSGKGREAQREKKESLYVIRIPFPSLPSQFPSRKGWVWFGAGGREAMVPFTPNPSRKGWVGRGRH